MLLIALLLPALAAAASVETLDNTPVDCKQSGYIPLSTVPIVDLKVGEKATCVDADKNKCPNQIRNIDDKLTDDAKKITSAKCNLSGKTYSCSFLDKDNHAIEVAFHGTKYVQGDNKECMLQGSLSAEYSMNFSALKTVLIVLGVILALLILGGCGICCFCGYCCFGRR